MPDLDLNSRFHLFENWFELPMKEKARSVLETVRRIIQSKYYKPKRNINQHKDLTIEHF